MPPYLIQTVSPSSSASPPSPCTLPIHNTLRAGFSNHVPPQYPAARPSSPPDPNRDQYRQRRWRHHRRFNGGGSRRQRAEPSAADGIPRRIPRPATAPTAAAAATTTSTPDAPPHNRLHHPRTRQETPQPAPRGTPRRAVRAHGPRTAHHPGARRAGDPPASPPPLPRQTHGPR
ncbi:hypothetical protein BDV59DRAFT_178310 [Aspergillus ambiguus]|uniref:uncharacterized protein n=1 Tax=Aspergillus ambiguus TaxID=176160 RepID=UPI003CCD7E52